MRLPLALTVAALVLPHSPPPSSEASQPRPARPAVLPFAVGERIEYSLSGKTAGFWLPLGGTGVMEVVSVDTVRGRDAFHIRFSIRGGVTGIRLVNDRFDSWLDVRTLASLRYWEDKHEFGYDRQRKFEIFPELKQFREDSNPPQPSVEHPLDDGSFLYFIRTIRLDSMAIGEKRSFPYYFRPERNPVTIELLRREKIKVGGREWDAVVIRPIITTSDRGLFTKDSDAEIWLSTDPSRIILKLRSEFSLKSSLTLALRSHSPGRAPAPARR